MVPKGINLSADFASTVQWSLLLMLTLFTTRVWVSEQNLIFLFAFFALSVFLQHPQDWDKVELLWLLLFMFVLVHVPVVSFFWLPLPWTLTASTAFADGPLGWTRLLIDDSFDVQLARNDLALRRKKIEVVMMRALTLLLHDERFSGWTPKDKIERQHFSIEYLRFYKEAGFDPMLYSYHQRIKTKQTCHLDRCRTSQDISGEIPFSSVSPFRK